MGPRMHKDRLKELRDAGEILRDPYMEWAESQGLPIAEGLHVDLAQVAVAPSAVLGARVGLIHLRGRGDYTNVILLELGPAETTPTLSHLYEEVVYVLSGRGRTVVELAARGKREMEWGPGSVFSLPLNGRYRLHNSDPSKRARLAIVTNLPLVFKTFRDAAFIFENEWNFRDRLEVAASYLEAGERLQLVKPGRDLLNAGIIGDVGRVELPEWPDRGPGSRSIKLDLIGNTMQAHISEEPEGSYRKAHRHAAGFHLLPVQGQGYILMWDEGDANCVRVECRPGIIVAPPRNMFHQIFNTGSGSARWLAISWGGPRYPFTEERVQHVLGIDKSVKAGGSQIEYADEDPLIRTMYEAELRSGMREGGEELKSVGSG